jgi:hypothetical protein
MALSTASAGHIVLVIFSGMLRRATPSPRRSSARLAELPEFETAAYGYATASALCSILDEIILAKTVAE